MNDNNDFQVAGLSGNKAEKKNQQGGALGGIAGKIPGKGGSPGGIAMYEAANHVSGKRMNLKVDMKESTSIDGASLLTFDNAFGTLKSMF